MLDGFAQDFLKPTKDNALLISKNAELEKSLENEKNVSKQDKNLANSQGNKVKVMIVELETKNTLIAEYTDFIHNSQQYYFVLKNIYFSLPLQNHYKIT